MKLTNFEIYQIANMLISNLQKLDVRIPAKANFFMQKNIATFTAAAQEIEKSRMEVIKHYGAPTEDGQSFNFSDETSAAANKELEDLFSIEQELDIKKFSIEALGKAEFTPAQMQALMVMIED